MWLVVACGFSVGVCYGMYVMVGVVQLLKDLSRPFHWNLGVGLLELPAAPRAGKRSSRCATRDAFEPLRPPPRWVDPHRGDLYS